VEQIHFFINTTNYLFFFIFGCRLLPEVFLIARKKCFARFRVTASLQLLLLTCLCWISRKHSFPKWPVMCWVEQWL